jgi:LAO/AO transport system kinase
MATRGRLGGLCAAAGAAANIMASAGCSVVIIETVGVGQSELDIVQFADLTVLVPAPGLGDDIQAMKAGLLEVADVIVVNKADASGAETLAMEMESISRDTPQTERQKVVCKTIASQGKGIEELASLIEGLDLLHKKDGVRSERREQKIRSEILDWAIELLRPLLAHKIEATALSGNIAPRQIAKKLMEKCLKTLFL